jgi:hypothetical protein
MLPGLLCLFFLGLAGAQPLGSMATTEATCNFGMIKDETKQSCRIPVPPGCVVANLPGTEKPWTNISKGGHTTCGFNEKDTDWTTHITGSCTRCRSEQCSARFSVMFDCSGKAP